jgi:L1 cell adhesion molecule like protein
MEKPDNCYLGIDLGTKNSCAFIFKNDQTKIVRNKETLFTTFPSVCYCYPNQRNNQNVFLVGDAAFINMIKNPQNVVYDAKRLIGKHTSDKGVEKLISKLPYKVTEDTKGRCKIELNGQQYFPAEISSKNISKIKQMAEEEEGYVFDSVVVTVPAYFDQIQREHTKDAAKISGFENVYLINEPTAAAIANGFHSISTSQAKEHVLVYDLGGGTFDVSLLCIHNNYYKVLAVGGDNFLGGGDFDYLMMGVCMEELKSKYEVDITDDHSSQLLLKFECEEAKKSLSDNDSVEISSRKLNKKYGIKFTHVITRSDFEELIREDIKKTVSIVLKTIKRSEINIEQIDKVLLVGGSTRIPLIRKELLKLFDIEKVVPSYSPDLIVAKGACIYAAYKNDYKIEKMPDFKKSDVVPFALGTNKFNNKFSVIIPKGQEIPYRNTKVYQTMRDNQSRINIKIFEGDNSDYYYNKIIGEFTMINIPKLPKGQAKVEVTIFVDDNTTLGITAKCLQNGKSHEMKIGYQGNKLSSKEMQMILNDENKNVDFEIQEQEKNDFLCSLYFIRNLLLDKNINEFLDKNKQKL